MNKVMEKKLRSMLEETNEKIEKHQTKVSGGACVFGVGALGTLYGSLTLSENSMASGMIVGVGGLLYRAINNRKLKKLQLQKRIMEYDLKHPENFYDYYCDMDEDETKHIKR